MMAQNRNLGIGEETIRKACHLAVSAQSSPEKVFLVENSQSEAIFSFPATWSSNDWFPEAEGPLAPAKAKARAFGETKVDLGMFRCLRSISNDERATVNEAFLQRFLTIKNTSNLLEEVEKAIKQNKQIIFTGHSSGGPTAIFATIWLFEQLRSSGTRTHHRTVCLTFGSPLSADRIFCHAVRRENWADSFIHFVSRYDIIPRVSLSPPSSTKPLLHEALSRLNPNGSTGPVTVQLASDLFFTVMRSVSCVASHAANSLMRSTSTLMDAVSGFVELSPYRPFGTFVFSSTSGKLFVLKNPEAVLQVLFYSLQLGSEGEGADVAGASLASHLTYKTELDYCLQKSDFVFFDEYTNIPLNSRNDADHETKRIDLALTDLGMSTTARLALRAAIELEKQKSSNQMKILQNKDQITRAMAEVESYRDKCEARGIGYFDAFKLMKTEDDFKANIKRLELVGLVDGIVEMLKRYELPEEFEGLDSWVDLGTNFRRLVEPVDIANYYLKGLNEDTGPYTAQGRPRKYKYMQRWLEHMEKRADGSCCESMVWAEVEELIIASGGDRDGSVMISIWPKVLQLESNLKEWWEKGVLEKGLFLAESSFVRWWKTLPEQHRAQSCITHLINSSSST